METLNDQTLKENSEFIQGKNATNFDHILKVHGLNFRSDGNYFSVGDGPVPGDRAIYISVIISQINALLSNLIPYLIEDNLSFAVIKNLELAKSLVNGGFGKNNIGKVMIILLPKNCNISIVLEKINSLTKSIKGPNIPEQNHLGGVVFSNSYQVENTSHKHEGAWSGKPRILNGKYLVLSLVKPDFKGDVLRGLYYKGILQFKKIIIKEGRKYMCSDYAGRDMKDRLEWQQKIHEDFSGLIHVPKVIDCFENDGNSYLVMEYIEGKSLKVIIEQIYNGRCWCQLQSEEKYRLYHLFIEILKIVEIVHNRGYIHRDLSLTNFILTSKNNLYLIDWELAYGINIQYPSPSFELGTEGYMSPEQWINSVPTYKEDIYALGALMIAFFTNMPPGKFDFQNPIQGRRGISFFTGENEIANIVTKCLNHLPSGRPLIREIKNEIEILANACTSIELNIPVLQISDLPEESEVSNLIDSALEGLTISHLAEGDGLFNQMDQFNGETGFRTICGKGLGLMSSITGILLVIGEAKPICSDTTMNFFSEYLDKKRSYFFSGNKELPSGLLYGSAGKALALSYGISTKLLPDNQEVHNALQDCFINISEEYDLSHGVAGQALSALLIYKTYRTDFYKERLSKYVEILLETQNQDGSWSFTDDLGKKRFKFIGLANGVAGIVCLLIKYDTIFPGNETKNAITRSLSWLGKNYRCNANSASGQDGNMKEDQSLVTGSAGIALTFLFAYDHMKTKEYKQKVDEILNCFPAFPLSANFSVATGLSGLGIVYLEALKIFSNAAWEERLIWIYKTIENTIHIKDFNRLSWSVRGIKEYDEGLLTGTSGVIMFLIKFHNIIYGKYARL